MTQISFVLKATRPHLTPALNEHWTEHLRRYLFIRGYIFEQAGDYFIVHETLDELSLRLIAQRYGQEQIGIYRQDTEAADLRFEPLF